MALMRPLRGSNRRDDLTQLVLAGYFSLVEAPLVAPVVEAPAKAVALPKAPIVFLMVVFVRVAVDLMMLLLVVSVLAFVVVILVVVVVMPVVFVLVMLVVVVVT